MYSVIPKKHFCHSLSNEALLSVELTVRSLLVKKVGSKLSRFFGLFSLRRKLDFKLLKTFIDGTHCTKFHFFKPRIRS